MANYWDRFVDAAQSLGARYFEESGVGDIVEELARFDFSDMSFSTIQNNIGASASLVQHTVDAPLQGLSSLAQEVNRLKVAEPLAAMNVLDDLFLGGERSPGGLEGIISPYENYATAWQPPTMVEEDDGTYHQAPGVYTAAKYGDFLNFGSDRLVSEGINPNLVSGIPLIGIPMGLYRLGTRFTEDGIYENGTYIPESFDLNSRTAGIEMAQGGLKYASFATNFATEAVLDPLNFIAGPIGAAIKARHVLRPVSRGIGEADTLAADVLAQVGSDRVARRIAQKRPGIGMIDQHQFLRLIDDDEAVGRALDKFVENKDPVLARDLFAGLKIADGDAAAELGKASVYMNTREEMMHLLNAGAYRNRESVDVVKQALSDNTALTNSFDTLLDTGDNIFEQALVNFPSNGILPQGHLLRESGKNFLDEALKANPEAQAAWEALDEGVQASKLATLASRKQAYDIGEQMFPSSNTGVEGFLKQADEILTGRPVMPERADQLVTGLPTSRQVKRAFGEGITGRFANSFSHDLRWGRTAAIVLPGSAHRLSPKFLLTRKPGMRFDLNGIDAIERFDDLGKYADSLIGSGSGWLGRRDGLGREFRGINAFRTTNMNLKGDYSFLADPEFVKIRNAFVDAASRTTDPQQLRAALVDELQHLVLRRIGQSAGFEEEVAVAIAQAGMGKGRAIMDDLGDASKGYTTVIAEDGVPIVLADRPTTLRQAANHIPIMDWANLRKALNSPAMRQSALASPDSLVSIAKEGQRGINITDTIGALGTRGKGSGVNLKSFGRDAGLRGVTHSIVDAMDIGNTLFKISVLLRLGYPVRNLTEGYASATGSGVGLMRVLGEANYPAIGRNTLDNWRNLPARASAWHARRSGKEATEETLRAALEQANRDYMAGQSHMGELFDTVADPQTTADLARIIKNSDDPELVQRARDALVYQTEAKLRMESVLGRQMTDARPGAGVSERMYHMDSQETLGVADKSWDKSERIYRGQTDGITEPLSVTPDRVAAQASVDRLMVDPFKDARKAADAPQWANGRFTKKRPAPKQWNEAVSQLDELAETHHVRYRASATAPWRAFTKRSGKARKYRNGLSEQIEFRAIPKDQMANPARPHVLAIDTWGKEVDLRSPDVRASLLDEYTNLDQGLLDAAAGGDRAAQNKVSNLLAENGVYRTVFDDAPEWGGVNVLVHPDGMSEAGFRRAVDSEIKSAIDRAATQLGPADDAIPELPRAAMKMTNRGEMLDMLPGHIASDYPVARAEVLSRGGFDEVIAEAIETQIDLRRRQSALEVAYRQRQAATAKAAKKRGLPNQPITMNTRYGVKVMPDMLHGVDGYTFGKLASADATTANTIAEGLHRTELLNDMRTSYLRPADITPDNPEFFDGLANLLGRMFRDTPGAEDIVAAGGKLTLDDVDPIIRLALQNGDRERLFEEAVEWAVGTDAGRNWVKSLNLRKPPTGQVSEALERGATAAARRPAVKAGSDPGVIQHRSFLAQERADGIAYREQAEVADVIAAQFNFVDNYMLNNPGVRDLFLEGKATAKSLRELYEREPWDLKPFSGMVSPTSAESKAMRLARTQSHGMAEKVTDRVVESMNNVLTKIGTAPETRVLKHPMFNVIAKTDLQQRVAHAQGTLGRDITAGELLDLTQRSQSFALRELKRTVYTLESRSTLEDYLRFVSPFFPAWYNTISRWGRFYIQNPANPAKIGARWNSVQASSMIVDQNGQPTTAAGSGDGFDSYLMLPVGLGTMSATADKLNKMFPGAAEAMSSTYIPLRTIDTIFQGDVTNPGAGPVVALPTQWILNHHVEWMENDLVKFLAEKIMPVGPTVTDDPTLDSLQLFMPTALRHTINMLTNNDAALAQYSKAYMILESKILDPEDDYKGEDIINDARWLSRLMMSVKITSALVSPYAQQQRGELEFYGGLYRELYDKAVALEQPEIADELFMEMFPAKYILAQSTNINLTGGAPTTWAAENQREYRDVQRYAAENYADPDLLWLVDNFHTAADGTSFIGMDTSDEFNQFARRWQFGNSPEGFTEDYRTRKPIEQILRDTQIKRGWHEFDKAEAEVQSRLVGQGLPVGSWDYLQRRQTIMADVSKQIAANNPEWANSRVIDTRRTEKNADFFQWLFSASDWIKGKEDDPLVGRMMSYIMLREEAKAVMEQAGDAKTSTAKANLEVKAWLDLQIEQLKADSPSFAAWHDKYFRNDIVTVDDSFEDEE